MTRAWYQRLVWIKGAAPHVFQVGAEINHTHCDMTFGHFLQSSSIHSITIQLEKALFQEHVDSNTDLLLQLQLTDPP